MSMEDRRTELLAHVAQRAAEIVRELGIDDARADHIGAAIADMVAEDCGGQVISFPKDAAYRLSLREQVILQEHRSGSGYADLMRRYNMTERGLRKLLKRAQDRHSGSRQQQSLDI